MFNENIENDQKFFTRDWHFAFAAHPCCFVSFLQAAPLFHTLEIENPRNATSASSTLTMNFERSLIDDEGVNQAERLTQLQLSVKTLLSWCDEYVLQL
jgi:glutathione peroxidase-family protein